jgi:hypothetical protein
MLLLLLLLLMMMMMMMHTIHRCTLCEQIWHSRYCPLNHYCTILSREIEPLLILIDTRRRLDHISIQQQPLHHLAPPVADAAQLTLLTIRAAAHKSRRPLQWKPAMRLSLLYTVAMLISFVNLVL